MDIQQENIKKNQDPLLEDTLKNVLKLAKKYRPSSEVNQVKLEFNVDISKESIIVNILIFGIK